MKPSLRYPSVPPATALKLYFAWLTRQLTTPIMWLAKWLHALTMNTPQPSPAIPSLRDSLLQANREFHWAQNCFNSVTDRELIDYAIYKMQAAQNKYNHFLKKLRSEAALKTSKAHARN